jgi:hypothetical protein
MARRNKKKQNPLNVSKIKEMDVGNTKEIVYDVSKITGQLTMNDVKNIRAKFKQDAEAKYNEVSILIRVLAGNWMTFKSEQSMNDYFESKVRDPSKFYEFTKMHLYVMVE